MSICITKARHRLKPPRRPDSAVSKHLFDVKASIMSFFQSISVSVGKLLGINQSSPFRNPLWCRKVLLHERELFRRSKNINAIIAFASNHRLSKGESRKKLFCHSLNHLRKPSPEKAEFWNIYHSDKSWRNGDDFLRLRTATPRLATKKTRVLAKLFAYCSV